MIARVQAGANSSLLSSRSWLGDIRASPCNCSAEAIREGRARPLDQDYSFKRFARCGEKVETMMRQIALLSAAISMGIFVSPASAQQAPPDQSAQPTQPASSTGQSMPDQAQQPSSSQEEPPPPPPFPPMPRARPSHRWVDLGPEHKSRAHRQSTRSHRDHATKTEREHGGKAHRGRAGKKSREEQPIAKKMSRKCLKMSVREAMRQSSCRSMMRDNLQEKTARHHASAHKRSGAERKHAAAHHHSTHQSKHRKK